MSCFQRMTDPGSAAGDKLALLVSSCNIGTNRGYRLSPRPHCELRPSYSKIHIISEQGRTNCGRAIPTLAYQSYLELR